MCGIVGVVGKLGTVKITAMLERMNDSIVHRGPDDDGIWANDAFGFGMRRLSIIDLAGGHQPMWSPSGHGIVYNGEIYNYRELRSDLAAHGYPFQTNCDTEVILALYETGGIDALERLRGMFALALFDAKARLLHLVRDRIGIKPLYYGEVAGSFFFASEIKAILAAAETKPKINDQAIYDYLTLRYVPGPQSVWQGIEKLQPGHHLTLDLSTGAKSVTPYWSMEIRSEPVDADRDYAREFEENFLSVVESHFVTADVPVGAMLSGGIDSSSVCAAAIELGHRNFHTFSYSTKNDPSNELQFARTAAEHLGTTHHEVVLGPQDFAGFLDRFVWHMDEPYRDMTGIPMFFLSECARRQVKVVLTGEGADELLAGYPTEDPLALERRLRRKYGYVPRAFYRSVARFLSGSGRRLFAALAEKGWAGYPEGRANHISFYWSDEQKREFWSGGPATPTEELIAALYADATSPRLIDKVQHAQMKSWLVEDLLMKADKMSMATSLEARVPFLDHVMVEWCATLPLDWKVRRQPDGNLSLKHVLREFARARIPGEIIDRKKQGFPISEEMLLHDSWDEIAEPAFSDPNSPLRNWIAMERMADLAAAARRGDVNALSQAWLLVMLDRWGRVWL